mgnify:CR=1 FL=1
MLTIAGVDHAEIGALIAEKWNFPEQIIGVIRYHHEPGEAPEEIKNLCSVVYIADMIIHYQNGDITFEDVDFDVLSRLHLTDEKDFIKLSNAIKEAFDKNSKIS